MLRHRMHKGRAIEHSVQCLIVTTGRDGVARSELKLSGILWRVVFAGIGGAILVDGLLVSLTTQHAAQRYTRRLGLPGSVASVNYVTLAEAAASYYIGIVMAVGMLACFYAMIRERRWAIRSYGGALAIFVIGGLIVVVSPQSVKRPLSIALLWIVLAIALGMAVTFLLAPIVIWRTLRAKQARSVLAFPILLIAVTVLLFWRLFAMNPVVTVRQERSLVETVDAALAEAFRPTGRAVVDLRDGSIWLLVGRDGVYDVLIDDATSPRPVVRLERNLDRYDNSEG
jgi:hypothetical protein